MFKFSFLLLLLIGCMVSMPVTCVVAQTAEAQKMQLAHRLIDAPANTWGYDILNNGKVFVHQPFIPGRPGKLGFNTKEKANAAALKVIDKIKNGIMPPTLSNDELLQIERSE